MLLWVNNEKNIPCYLKSGVANCFRKQLQSGISRSPQARPLPHTQMDVQGWGRSVHCLPAYATRSFLAKFSFILRSAIFGKRRCLLWSPRPGSMLIGPWGWPFSSEECWLGPESDPLARKNADWPMVKCLWQKYSPLLQSQAVEMSI